MQFLKNALHNNNNLIITRQNGNLPIPPIFSNKTNQNGWIWAIENRKSGLLSK